ncbi:hypothetical protein FJW04_17810 [Mesorhizobium sp. B2-7-3]|uniref:hypothetical protein n=1 Tax=Mesorhizobium sp. B2-7-3 TaxID=2589907 RepID=UPI00112DAFB9|nr:hypothetical protein [Mesorhizobium sp. B2-7-3]TPJ14344.1 hypothetical protein FJW04_17810 [Mesorhizobium sp. B2-7-3]
MLNKNIIAKMVKMYCLNVGIILIMATWNGRAVAQDMTIDWSVCTQPDLTSDGYAKKRSAEINTAVANAKKRNSKAHIAVALNKYYGEMVQIRRDHVRLKYMPISEKRPESSCALSDKNYEKLLLLRDASYYVMCRSEVAIGASKPARLLKDLKSLAFAAIYDLKKSLGADLRAKKDEPTTPPGGYAACELGVADGLNDPFPQDGETSGFETRLVVPDSEKPGIGEPSEQ